MLKSPSLPFDEVTGGYLRLRGFPREAWFHPTRSERITWQGVTRNQDRNDDDVPVGEGFRDSASGFSDTVQDNVEWPIVCSLLCTVGNIKDRNVGGLMLVACKMASSGV